MIDILAQVVELLQVNIVQSLFAVFVAVLVGSRRGWGQIIIISVIAFAPAFFVIGVLIDLLLQGSYITLAAIAFIMLGTAVGLHGGKK